MIRNTIIGVLAVVGLSFVAGCDNSAPPAPGGGGGGGVKNLSETPSSLAGRSAATARTAVRAAGAQQDATVVAAQEMSGEAEAITVGGLAWSAPTIWQKVKPSSTMRAAEIKVPSAAGHGEGNIAFFANVGGDAMSNIERWRSQFAGAGGTPPEADIQQRTIAGCKVWLVSINGLFKGGQPGGPAGDSPDYGLRGAIVDGPKGMIFIKFIGPEATLLENEGPWSTMVNGMRKQ